MTASQKDSASPRPEKEGTAAGERGSMSDIEDKARRALELCEEATDGPWQQGQFTPGPSQRHIPADMAQAKDRVERRTVRGPGRMGGPGCNVLIPDCQTPGNAVLIAESRQLLPALAQAVLDLSADLREMTESAAEYACLASKPAIEPGGFVWLTGWLDLGAGDASQRSFVTFPPPVIGGPRVHSAYTEFSEGVWRASGGDEFWSEEEAKAAAEKWAHDTYGASDEN